MSALQAATGILRKQLQVLHAAACIADSTAATQPNGSANGTGVQDYTTHRLRLHNDEELCSGHG